MDTIKDTIFNPAGVVQIFQPESMTVTFMSDLVTGGAAKFFGSTLYTENDNVKDALLFGVAQVNRLVDLDNQLLVYESRYGMKSNVFYSNWRSQPAYDKSEFNKWADLYRFIQYAQE